MDASSPPLMIGVSTRALFSLEEEHQCFEQCGVEAYIKLQQERENILLERGTAFDVIERLLALNEDASNQLVNVILLSKNSPDLSLRAFRSTKEHKLDIDKGSFTSGRAVAPFIGAWNIDLFLSNDAEDVRSAVEAGTAAAKLGNPPKEHKEVPRDEVRFALDGDAVIFGSESDNIYKNHGLAKFLEHETENAQVPMNHGPFGKFLYKLSILRSRTIREDGRSKVRIAIVTSRSAPSHERVVYTLRAWRTPADEAHFVGNHPKAPILKAIGAHIFFDDQEKHVLSAAEVVPSGLVPGPHAPDSPIIPAAT